MLQVLTDFTPARAEAWPTIDAGHFEVHELGATWAEVTEATPGRTVVPAQVLRGPPSGEVTHTP